MLRRLRDLLGSIEIKQGDLVWDNRRRIHAGGPIVGGSYARVTQVVGHPGKTYVDFRYGLPQTEGNEQDENAETERVFVSWRRYRGGRVRIPRRFLSRHGFDQRRHVISRVRRLERSLLEQTRSRRQGG